MRAPTSTPATPWSSGLAGASAGGSLLGAWYLLYGLRIAPFPPFDFADFIIRFSPGGLATWGIETLEHRAQPTIVVSAILAFVGLWALGGIVILRWPSPRTGIAFGLLQAPLVVALAQWADGRGVAGFIWITTVLAVTLAAAGAMTGHWAARLADEERAQVQATAASDDWMSQIGTRSRRELLRQILASALIAGVGGSIAGSLLRSAGVNERTTAANTPLDDLRAIAASTGLPNVVTPGTVETAEAVEDSISLPFDVRQRITSNRDFYIVDISFRKPVIHEAEWSLRVHGLVEREITLTYADLLGESAVEMHGTLMCISYTHGNDLISSTTWTGVPLQSVLERAGVRDGVVDVVCRGAGGYSDSITLADALAPNTILAYDMNGVALPRDHGFPCRLYVPGLYGEKNVKWLQEIELVDYDYQGYWQERGWTDIAIINTMSAIDAPRGDVDGSLDGGVPVGGIAFAGTRGVQLVEVRVDDGDWQRAEVEPNDPELLWQRWRFQWQPEAGPHTLTVRCVDGSGDTQTAEEREPHPDGMTGLHSIDVVVF